MQIIIDIIKVIIIASAVLTLIPLLIWWERKGAAYIQDRRGPNRANILGIRLGGLVHNFADVFKLFFKEDIIPEQAHKILYLIAPMIVMCVVVASLAVIPFASPVQIGGYTLRLQIADLNVGILYILAITSLSVYGILLAGWSSSNTYSILGGLRASAQMISYEVAMGLALISLLVWAGTVRLDEIVTLQGVRPWDWNCARQPLAFIIFFICLFAETNRNPFDLPEGESEIVAGYHTEYSSMKFAMFFMAEYAHIVVGSMILTSLFLGGWQVPFLSTEMLNDKMPLILKIAVPILAAISILGGIRLAGLAKKFGWGDMRDLEPAIFGFLLIIFGILCAAFVPFLWYIPTWLSPFFTVLIQMATFLIKVLACSWFFIWVRWTLPRFRYDQLMGLGWKVMVPLALINIVVTGIIIIRL